MIISFTVAVAAKRAPFPARSAARAISLHGAHHRLTDPTSAATEGIGGNARKRGNFSESGNPWRKRQFSGRWVPGTSIASDSRVFRTGRRFGWSSSAVRDLGVGCAPAGWREPYRGHGDEGWDQERREHQDPADRAFRQARCSRDESRADVDEQRETQSRKVRRGEAEDPRPEPPHLVGAKPREAEVRIAD